MLIVHTNLLSSRLCLKFEFQFQSKVVLCEPASLNRKNSDGKEELVHGYNVVLEDTILFPEGGGQVSIFIGDLSIRCSSVCFRKQAV